MPIKDWLHRLEPVQLYIIQALSICYFTIQIILSHFTHALTLQFSAFHMLCNIIALTGRILTIKHSRKLIKRRSDSNAPPIAAPVNNSCKTVEEDKFVNDSKIIALPQSKRQCYDGLKLRNTFGWTRIDILTMSVVFIFLTSLSFSNIVEAIKMLMHIDHKDTTHYPLPILATGAGGLILNALSYLLIGGYTIHFASIIKFTPNRDACLDTTTDNDNCNNDKKKINGEVQTIERYSSVSKRDVVNTDDVLECNHKRQGVYEIFRDISSSAFVILCGSIVHISGNIELAKYVDPILSIFSAVLLIGMSYPYMRESCLILLQTIPGTIDIHIFKKNLSEKFHEIVNVHDLHIWSLTSSKYVSTVHIIFKDPITYKDIMNDIKKYFYDQGITIITIQPEFLSEHNKTSYNKNGNNELTLDECLVPCHGTGCIEKSCCRSNCDLKEVVSISDKHCCYHGNNNKTNEILNNLDRSNNKIIEFKTLSALSLDSSTIKNQINCSEKYSSLEPNNCINKIKKFQSDSQISQISCTISTNISDSDKQSTLDKSQEDNLADVIKSSSGSCSNSSNENFDERL